MLKKYLVILGLMLLLGCNQKINSIEQDVPRLPDSQTENENDKNIIFNFSVNEIECNRNLIFGETELESDWTENILTIKKAAVINSCNSEILNGNYKINDNQILLEYEISPCGQFCCDSDSCQELTFRFEGLEKKDYEFEIERI
jgi:hypothetical protein